MDNNVEKNVSAIAFLPEVILLVAMIALLFMNTGVVDIDTYSELFHLESAKESLAAGRFWTPLLNGHDYLVRSPFWTWLVLGSFKLMGVSLFAARVPAFILSLTGLGLVYMLTLELTKTRFSAFFAAATLGTTWGYFQMSGLSTGDILVTNIYLGFFWALLKWHSFASRRSVISLEMDIFSVVFGVLIGLLLLTKGTLALLLLLVIAGFYLALHDGGRYLDKLNMSLVVLPALLIPLPWLLWASFHGGGPMFLMDYLLVQPWQKFIGAGLWQNLSADWLFFLKRLPGDLMPYVLFIPAILFDPAALILRSGSQHSHWVAWLLGWFLVGLAVYSFSAFQEPTMMLPFYAPVTILVGYYLGQVMESPGGKTPERYMPVLIAYILLMMTAAVMMTILIFQVVPSNYVAGFWQLPGQPVIEFLQLGKHAIELPEAFPLWKFWLIPGPFVLLIGGLALFIMQAGRRLSVSPLALVSTVLIFLFFIKAVYLPIMNRPVAMEFARQINRVATANDRIVLFSLHPDVKRVLFYLDVDKLHTVRFARDAEAIKSQVNHADHRLYGVMREQSFFKELDYSTRSLLQVVRFDWKWDMTKISEFGKFAVLRLPLFEHMRSGMLYFTSLPPEALKALNKTEAQSEDAKKSGKKRRRRR